MTYHQDFAGTEEDSFLAKLTMEYLSAPISTDGLSRHKNHDGRLHARFLYQDSSMGGVRLTILS